MGVGVGLAILAIFMIVGVLIQLNFPRTGRALICFGALLLTFFVFDIGFFMITERRAGSGIMPADVYVLLSIILAAACDVAIVFEELRIRRFERIVKGNSQMFASATNG